MPRQLTIPDYGLVVLVGTAGAGKTTFAERNFRASEILSSDHYRSVVGDDARRLRRNRGDCASAAARAPGDGHRPTNVHDDDRKRYVEVARGEHAPVCAIVLDLKERDCQEQNARRGDGARPGHVVRRQWRALQRSVKLLSKQGYRRRYRLRTPDEAREASIVREPLDCDIRDQHGPFDIIGDVHGCRPELEALLGKLGYRVEAAAEADGPHYEVTPPAERRAVFVGDIADRGPDSAGALALVMDAVAGGAALVVPGNHDSKLARATSRAPTWSASTDSTARATRSRSGLSASLPGPGRRRASSLVGHPANDDARKAIRSYGVQSCPVILHQRIDHQHAFTEGLSATEMAPDGKAASEIRELERWIRSVQT